MAILLILAASCCYAGNMATIYGTILNRLGDTVEVSYNDNILAYYPKTYYARVDKAGKFRLRFEVPAYGYTQVELKHGNRVAELMIHKGDSLKMQVNGLHFDSSINYTGPGSSIQNFVARHTLERGRINQYQIKIKTAINSEPKEFLKAISTEKATEMKFLDKYASGLPVQFVKYWRAYYQYYNYFFIQQYPQTHHMIKMGRYTDTVPADNYVVTDSMQYAFNDSLLNLAPYVLYLTGVVETRMKSGGYTAYRKDKEGMVAFEDSMYRLAYAMLPTRSAEYFIAQNLYGRARSQELIRSEDQLKDFKARWPNSQYTSFIEKQLSITRRLAPGKLAPDITLTNADGKKIKLSELKGNVIYLSFWAHWCRQCVGEMISARKIKELVSGQPVVFAYVSIDGDAATDSIVKARYKVDGLHTTVPGVWSSREAELYSIQSLPAYFLIDKEGRFAVQNTPTPPQHAELLQAIVQLLK